MDARTDLFSYVDQRIIQTEQRLGMGLDPHKLNLDKATGLLSLGKSLEADEESRREGQKHATRKRIEEEILSEVLSAGGDLPQSEILDRVKGKDATVLATLKEMDGPQLHSYDKDGARWYSLAKIEEEVVA